MKAADSFSAAFSFLGAMYPVSTNFAHRGNDLRWEILSPPQDANVLRGLAGQDRRGLWSIYNGIMKAILFDIDGTLITTRGAGRAALLKALEAAFGCSDHGEISMSGRTDRAIARELFRVNGLEDSDSNWQTLKEHYLERLPGTVASCEGAVLPGIHGLLEEISQRAEILVGLLTGNSQQGAQIKLEHFDIWQHFSFGGYGEFHLERNDVAVDALAEVHQRADIPPEDVVVIGDTPRDVQCARHIGAKAIAVLTGWNSREELEASQPDELFEDLTDTNDVLRKTLNVT